MTKDSNSRKNWAVLVGINDYGHPENNLHCCVNDMKAIENYLLQTGFAKDNVRRLTCDAENDRKLPTYSNIEREILAVCEAAGSDDFIAVFFSGHGCQHGDAPQFDLPGRDSISIDKIYRALGACRAKFKLLVVDACRSIRHLQLAVPGQSFRCRSSVLATDLGQFRDPPPGIVLISSCADGEVSWESGEHGVFTRCFLEGLTGKADLDKDGVISFLELCKYTMNETTSRAKAVYEAWAKEHPEAAIHLKKKTQTPYIKGEYTDFPFARSFASSREISSFSGANSRNNSTPNPLNNQMTDKWNLTDSEFAKRLGPGDVENNTFTIPLGTRALVIENGIYLGEVPMGKYTPSSPVPSSNGGVLGWFSKFFGGEKKEKKADVHAVLVRQEDIPIEELTLPRLLTNDDRSVDVTVRFVVQIRNITSFVQNLFGSRQLLSVGDIEKTISLIIAQGLRETIKRLSSESLDSPDVRDILITGIKDAVNNSLLGRYGIDCADIHVAEIYNKEKEALRGIQQDERENDLSVLAAHVELDRSEADIALELRRNQIRKNTRDAVLSDKFDEIKTAEEFKAFCLQIDKQKLLREDEWDELAKLYESKKDDRQSAREFLVRKLELDRNAELDRLSAEIAHAQKIKSQQHEIELTRLNEDEDTRKWRKGLELEAEQAEHGFQEKMKAMQRQHELNVKNLTLLNADEWEDLLHKQKINRQQKEFETEQAAADVRRKRIEDEYEDEQKRRKYAFDKEVQSDQMTQLEKMQEMNQKRDEFEANLLMKTEAQRNQHQLDVLKTETSAKVEMSKNESVAQTTLRDEAARRERELQDQRVLDAQKNNETTLAAIQAITGQAFGAIGQSAGRPATPMSGTDGTPTTTVRVCVHCRAENKDPGAKFCSNCGKEL